jgi:hypothetical protein
VQLHIGPTLGAVKVARLFVARLIPRSN